MTGRKRGVRRALIGLGALLTGLATVPLAGPAAAAEVVVDCSGLQAAFNDPANTKVTLQEGAVCNGSFDLPDGRAITFEGGGTGATLDGIDNDGDRILFGDNVGETVIRNLTFRNGDDSGDGAAIELVGTSSPTIENVRFFGNHSGNAGGAVAIEQNTEGGAVVLRDNTFGASGSTQRNGSDEIGGALYVDAYGPVTLDGNTFTGNSTEYLGGGAVLHLNLGAGATITDNRFAGNEVAVPFPGCAPGAGYGGGALAIVASFNQQPAEGDDGISDVTQRGNVFGENRVRLEPSFCSAAFSAEAVAYSSLSGGAELVRDAFVTTVGDQFLGNAVDNTAPAAEGSGEAEGGALSVEAVGGRRLGLTGHNLVVAGNQAIGDGMGGGIYVGDSGLTGVDVHLVHATVVANAAAFTGGGLSGGVAADADTLLLENSIVFGNTAGEDSGTADLDGFTTVKANFSDVCEATGQALAAGSGDNICADPKLVAPGSGDVHQTDASPTLDVASNALVPSDLTTDYEGQSRISDAKGDGPTPAVADMGADELQAPPPPEPPAVAGENQTAPGSIGEDDGYCLSAKDGGVFTFGACEFFGAADQRGVGRVRLLATDITAPQSLVKLNAPVVGIAMQPSDTGYWQAAEDGGVFSFGTAGFHGSMAATPLTKPIVGIASSPSGNGYWLVASDGGVFGFGDAPFLGSMGGTPLAKPIVGITATPSGKGYWLVASDGGVFSFGDAQFFGSAAGTKLNAPIVGMGARPGGLGYWLAASDGGVFTFGDAPFLGNRVGLPLNAPVIGIKSAASGNGYWLIAGDGGVFSFGSAPFLGSMGDRKLNQPVIDMTG